MSSTIRKLGRDATHRTHMLRNLATSLVEHERLVTTVARAREVSRMTERLVTRAKKGDDKGVRSKLYTPETVNKMMGPIAERYKDRQGGYCRVLKVGIRHSDAAPMAMIEFVGREGEITKESRFILPKKTAGTPSAEADAKPSTTSSA